MAARPGIILIRVSRAMSFGPNAKPASRVLGSRDAAASLSASSTARAVSIMAQTLTEAGAPSSLKRAPILLRSSTVEIFGTNTPSGATAPAIAESSDHQEVSRLLVRIRISRLPKPLAWTAAAICSRAFDLASGATESSRSRIRQSAARLRAFSSARAFDPGMNNRLRRGRVMVPSHILDPRRYHFSPSAGSLVTVTGIWLGKGHDLVPENTARRLPDLHHAKASDRAKPIPRF